jgi:hypothetical protein
VVSTPAMGLLIWRTRAARRPCCCSQANTPAGREGQGHTPRCEWPCCCMC